MEKRIERPRMSTDVNEQANYVENTIFVGGISFLTTKETLSEKFSQFGEILDINVP